MTPADIPMEALLLVPGPLTCQTAVRGPKTFMRLADPRDGREAYIEMATQDALAISLLRLAIQRTLTRVWGNA